MHSWLINRQLTNIFGQKSMTSHEVTNHIFLLYARYGLQEYIGEPVSQLEHMSQAAQLAMDEGQDDEVVLAAFLHDIGHLCVSRTQENNMAGFGTKDHQKIGADYLRDLGFPEKIAALVEGHVEAKRYLCFINPEYLTKLSEASQETLKLQGGIMTSTEAQVFEQNPLRPLMVKMRLWDDAAKEINQGLIDFDLMKEKMEAVLKRTFVGA
jgi:phosphonate degradation associated HDIG domain protein